MLFLWTKIFKFYQFHMFFTKNIEIFIKLKKLWGAKTENSRKNSRKKLKVWEDFSTPEEPSGVKTSKTMVLQTTSRGGRNLSGKTQTQNSRKNLAKFSNKKDLYTRHSASWSNILIYQTKKENFRSNLQNFFEKY